MTPEQRDWRRHRHALRYQRRLACHRLWGLALLALTSIAMLAAVAWFTAHPAQ